MSLRHYIASLQWAASVFLKIHLLEDTLLHLAMMVPNVRSVVQSVVQARSEVPLLVVYMMLLTVVPNPQILSKVVVATMAKPMDSKTSILEKPTALHTQTLTKVHLIRPTASKTWLMTWT